MTTDLVLHIYSSGYCIFPLSLQVHKLLEVPESWCLTDLMWTGPLDMGADRSSPLP